MRGSGALRGIDRTPFSFAGKGGEERN